VTEILFQLLPRFISKIKQRKNVAKVSFAKDRPLTKGYVGVSCNDAVDKETEHVDGWVYFQSALS